MSTIPGNEKLAETDTESFVAIAGHPIHAALVHFPIAFVFATAGSDVMYAWTGDVFWPRAALWASGLTFLSGIVASIVGTAELLLVSGIRTRAASWTHGIAAMMLLSLAGMNWGVRLDDHVAAVLPLGLTISALACVFAAFAGYHGGKLVFHHGVGMMISADD